MNRPVRLLGAAFLSGIPLSALADAPPSPGRTARIEPDRRVVPFDAARESATDDSSSCDDEGCNLLKGLFGGKTCGRAAVAGRDDEARGNSFTADALGSSEITRLLSLARSASAAQDRAEAVAELGRMDCRRRPEISAALFCALSDADPEVRRTSAESIGSLLEGGRCGRPSEAAAALTSALSDYEESVRETAEKALKACGHPADAQVRENRGTAAAAGLPRLSQRADGPHSLTSLFGLGG